MTSNPRLYFAYGSNLSLAQMASRCPRSSYESFGLLRNYKWIIGERGYANIIHAPSDQGGGEQHVVYGMLYALESTDEVRLDRAEGVPYAYTKHILEIELIAPAEGKVSALVYVDERRRGEGVCLEEYVGRVNCGVEDATQKGMERWYVERYIRPFVPAGEPGGGETGDPFHPSGVYS